MKIKDLNMDLKEYKKYLNNDKKIEELSEEIADLKRGVAEREKEGRLFKIGIVGQVKAGKSSFLNSLLFEENLLPTAVTPMTASLTVIEYATENKAEVEFYSTEDWNEIEKHNTEYEMEYKLKVEEYKKECEEKAKEFNPSRVSVNEIDEILRSAHEIYENFRKNNLTKEKLGTKEILEIGSKENFATALKEYVGSDGKYTPLVKSTTLYIHDEKIRDYNIVDTPGTNDPIISRGRKTRELLSCCDYIIFLSYSAQFLDQSDYEYILEKLPSSGQKEVLIIGTKFDLQLNQESVVEEARGDIVKAYKTETTKLGKKLDTWKTRFIKDKKEMMKTEVVFQSTFAYKIAKNYKNLNEDLQKALDKLRSNYPNSNIDQKLLLELSCMNEVREKIQKILENKHYLMNKKIKDLTEGKFKSFHKYLDSIAEDLNIKKTNIEEDDIFEYETKGQELKNQIEKISDILKKTVYRFKEEVDNLLKNEIQKIVSDQERSKTLEINNKTIEYEEDYDVGWFQGWKFWPHEETRTVYRNQSYIDIQDSIEKTRYFAESVEEKIRKISDKILSKEKLENNLKNSVLDLFAEEEKKKIRLFIENIISNLVLPKVELSKEKYIETITEEYNSFSSGENTTQIQAKHKEILERIMSDTKNIIEELKEKTNICLTMVEESVTKELCNRIDEDIQKLRDMKKNAKESLSHIDEALEKIKVYKTIEVE